MLSVIIDWLEFTVLNSQLPLVMDTLGLKWDDFTALKKGRFGYHNQYKWSDGSIFIMFTATNEEEAKKNQADMKVNPKAGVHVMISGQGCRQYSCQHDLVALIRRLYILKQVNFSRIDLAIDDLESKIINYDRIHKSAMAGHFTSRWSKWDEVNSRQTSTNEFLGRTMYFGSKVSDLYMRIYDKTLERKANDADDKDIPRQWTRLEIVYKKDRAKKLTDYLITDEKPLGEVLRGTLKQYLRFLLPSTDKNKARWPTAEWWDQLLENVQKLKLTIKKEAKTIEDMIAWIEKQIAPTMATVVKAQCGDLEWVRSVLVEGSKRLSQRHLDAISQYSKRGIAA